ncbi:MAG: single-stranded-DNA-specific exonuclease RecJ [Acidobacteriota bacterium]
MQENIWIVPELDDRVSRLASDLEVSLETAQILFNRGIKNKKEAHKFLFPNIKDLYDPYLMESMEQAVQRIERAVRNKEKILVFGDYDADGILSIVVLMKAIESLGGCIDYFIPDRLRDGYGIKPKHLKMVLERKIDLVISVDCGIKAVEFTEKARANGVDVIITDHHQPGPELPKAVAVLNPALSRSLYPDKNLAGIGVVFKVIQALMEKRNKNSVLVHYLKLVSIGTVADVVKLRGENRLFVKFGLEGLKNVSNKGLKNLLSVCGIGGRDVTTSDIGFRIAPRLNAAGRLGKAGLSVDLFRVKENIESQQIAVHLNKLNSLRQKAEENILDQAVKKIEKKNLDRKYKLLALGSEQWHRGIIGIVASRLKDLYYRPVLLFSYENGKAFGSGRSIKEFSLIKGIQNSGQFCISYGGHPLAVGCEIDHNKFDAFRESINNYAALEINEEALIRKIHIDAKIDFRRLTTTFLKEISRLKPYGVGNPKPIFLSEKVCVASSPRILKGKHSKFILRKDERVFEALGWGRKDWADRIKQGDWADIVYSLHSNEYLGKKRLNLVLYDIKPAER